MISFFLPVLIDHDLTRDRGDVQIFTWLIRKADQAYVNSENRGEACDEQDRRRRAEAGTENLNGGSGRSCVRDYAEDDRFDNAAGHRVCMSAATRSLG